MIKRTVLCLIIGVGFMASACGDDLGEKAASDLTADERTEVCEELSSYYSSKISESDEKKLGCVTAGEAQAAFDPETTCAEARDACLAAPAEGDTGVSFDCGVTDAIECEATVDEIRGCLEAQVDQLDSFYSDYDCGVEASFPTTAPAACDAYIEKCPEQFAAE